MKNPLSTEIKFLKGVGENRAQSLRKLGIETIGDLLEHFPRDYINRFARQRIEDLIPEERNSFIGEVIAVEKKRVKNKFQLHVVISDGREYLFCIWFKFGKWLQDKFETGQKIWVSGIVTVFAGSFQMIHPEIEILDEDSSPEDYWHKRSVLPVYPLTGTLSINFMRKLVLKAFELYHMQIVETLPAPIIQKYQFESRLDSLRQIHFGEDQKEIWKARNRFIFEELFYYQLMLARSHHQHHHQFQGHVFQLKRTLTTRLKESLPFELTRAQKRVIREIVEDMTSARQMNRLLQGDVGSGKTIITLFAMLLAVENDYQAILMAPTEILAEQHFRNFSNLLLEQLNIKIVMLKGGNYRGKKDDKKRIAVGEADIIIGTHALLQKDVFFFNAGLIVIDEQHRFGVKQRAVLAETNQKPDLLYLSATPIPRSLALTLYGDLDISILDELPPGRKPVKTIWHDEHQKNSAYIEARRQVEQGGQVYIVCPLIEESEKISLRDAETVYLEVSTRIFPDFKCSLLHGRIPSQEKDEIMEKFKRGEIQVLVSTTVIEVGIDVPQASVMIIEHAERFGLSQLHQLRGRVGRGSAESYCFLISYSPISKEGRERLKTMVASGDGFKIAEKDLELRGPGEFFGTEQSGIPVFRHADLVRDQKILVQARKEAFEIIEKDHELCLPEHENLAVKYFAEYFEKEKLFDF
ncbi:MAG: ATP-dependent DNA helicase RecG [Candidatus Cloacimonetes bacterium]|nr:ATP-dependent DNA helicase RecG [Candidatus Cloacimonadota bacterium]